MKHLKTYKQLNELHSDTYYSAANKINTRSPGAKNRIQNLKNVGRERKFKENEEMWNSLPEPDVAIIELEEELYNIFDMGGLNNCDYRFNKDKNVQDLSLEIDMWYGYLKVSLYFSLNQYDDYIYFKSGEYYHKEEDMYCIAGYDTEHDDENDNLLTRKKAIRLYDYMKKCENVGIDLDINIDNRFHIDFSDVRWDDFWNQEN